MRRPIIFMMLSLSNPLLIASSSTTTFIQPIPFERQMHGNVEFLCGLAMGTATTLVLLNPRFAQQDAELIFSGCLGNSFVIKQAQSKPYKIFATDYRVTGRTICSLVSKSVDAQIEKDFCDQYVELRRKQKRCKPFLQENHACDSLLVALNPREIKKDITLKYHNKVYADALSDLKKGRMAEGFLYGSLFGFAFVELLLLNAITLFSWSSPYSDNSYPVNSVV